MEISPRRSTSLIQDRSIVSPIASSCSSTCGNYRTSVYATQAMKSSDEDKFSNSYVMKSSPCMDSSMKRATAPRKANFFASMFGAIASIVVERLGKVPSSLMSNIHNTLSVTVVPNEGIITQDFFKNLTQNCEESANEQDTMENSRITDKYYKKSIYDVESSLSNILTDEMKKSPLHEKLSLNFEFDMTDTRKNNENFNDSSMFDCPVVCNEKFNELDVRIMHENTIFNENTTAMRNARVEFEKILDRSDDCATNDSIEARISSVSSRSAVSNITEDRETMEISNNECTLGWKKMWRKVIDDMSERFAGTSDASSHNKIFAKASNSPKSSRRKSCTVARGCGKGRGKSQLRRNGVSQSRHRRERMKQDINSNIQDDLRVLEDPEFYDESENDDDCSSSIDERKNDRSSALSRDTTDSSARRSCFNMLENLSFDVSSSARKRKKAMPDSSSKCPMLVRYVPEISMEIENENNDLSYGIENERATKLADCRPRFLSESSVDSEDSYCIVFENDSESEYTDDDSDEASDDAISDDDDDDDADDDGHKKTVRFNLEPRVQTMIKWDYAYRAARRGPWEEMARDRERFRGRTQCIERILNPILSVQHRSHIWRERFDVDEGSRPRELF